MTPEEQAEPDRPAGAGQGFAHTPVLLNEVLVLLEPASPKRYIDATVGGAGHAEKILELSSPEGRLLGIDADPVALEAARVRLASFGQRTVLVESSFDRLDQTASQFEFQPVDGVLFDLGVSSGQLDTPERGFSFQQDAPLDMRLGPQAGTTASQLINGASSSGLEKIFREYGEERYARRIAQRIVQERSHQPILTTSVLADIVTRAKPRTKERIHPATRVFQALRIAVNDELERLRRALPQAVELLRAGGHLVVISFHSLEDRIVKQFLQQEARGCVCPPDLPACACGNEPRIRILTRKPIRPSADEVKVNRRARSAKLRAAEVITKQLGETSDDH